MAKITDNVIHLDENWTRVNGPAECDFDPHQTVLSDIAASRILHDMRHVAGCDRAKSGLNLTGGDVPPDAA